MKKHKGLRLAAALLVLLLLAGCGAGSGAADSTAAAQGAVTEESYDAALTETGSDAASDRKLITTADLSLDVTDFDAATGEIERQVEELGGYLASSSKGGSAESASRWAPPAAARSSGTPRGSPWAPSSSPAGSRAPPAGERRSPRSTPTSS